jgi:hypothetical protein
LQPFHGVIDEVRFYDYALSASAIAAFPGLTPEAIRPGRDRPTPARAAL